MITLDRRELGVRMRYVNSMIKAKGDKLTFNTDDMGDKIKVSLKLGAKQHSFIYINKQNNGTNPELEAQRNLLCRFCVDRQIDIVI